MIGQENQSNFSVKRPGWWAGIIADFRVLWTTVTAGIVVGCAIGSVSAVLSYAAFRGGHWEYGLAYLLTALFIAISLPIGLFFVQRQKN